MWLGADLINDVWGGWDLRLLEVAARYGTGLVCAHTVGADRGTAGRVFRVHDVPRRSRSHLGPRDPSSRPEWPAAIALRRQPPLATGRVWVGQTKLIWRRRSDARMIKYVGSKRVLVQDLFAGTTRVVH